MNISAIDYKENVTIARLKKRYLPKRFIPNYSNCLLQKEISSDAFLLKKSGSDDHLFLRFRKGDSTKENIKRRKETIVKQSSKSKLPPLLRNQMLTKSMSMQQFYKVPIDIGSTIKLKDNNKSDIIIHKSEIYIKQLLEKKNRDLFIQSKNPKRNEELFKKLPSLIETSLRNSGITSLRGSPLEHLLESESLSRNDNIQKLIHNPIIQYKFCEKIVNSITHRIQFLDNKNQEIYEKDVINIIDNEIDSIIEDKTIINHHRNFSTQGLEVEPKRFFPQHSLVSNYEEVIKFRNYYKKLLENSNSSSSSSSANKRYISHFLTNENGIQEFLKNNSNKETLMEMLLKNEKIKNSSITNRFFPLSERNRNKQYVTSYQSKFFPSADKTIQHKGNKRNKSGVDMKNCSVQTGEDLYNSDTFENRNRYRTIDETEKKSLISLLKSKPTKKEMEEFNVIYRKEQKEVSETSKTIVKSSDTIHTVHLTSGSNVTNNIQPSKKYKRFESILNSRKSSTTQLSILKEQKENKTKENHQQQTKVEVKKRNAYRKPIVVNNTNSKSNDLGTLESTYKTKSVSNIIRPKKQFNSFSDSEKKEKSKKNSITNIEVIKKKEKDKKKDESFAIQKEEVEKKKSISKSKKKKKKEASSLPKPKVHNMGDELKKIKKKMKNHKMVLNSKDNKSKKEEEQKKTLESLHDIGITNTAENKKAIKEEPDLWVQMVERAKNRKRKINIFGEEQEQEDEGPKLIKTLESHLEEKKKFTETLQSNKSEKTDEMKTSKRSSVADNSQIMAAIGNRKISKFRRRNAMNAKQLSTYFHQNMRNDTGGSGSSSKRNNIKLKEQLQRKKFFFDLDNTEEVEKRKNMLLLKMSQDITYGIAKGDFTEKDKSLFEEFKRKIEELRNFDDKTYVLFLENNFSYFQEELDMLRKIREDEKRINDFIKYMNNDIDVDNMKKKEQITHARVIDKKVIVELSRPFVLASPKILD